MLAPLLRAYLGTPEHPGKYRFVRWLGRHAFPERGIPARVFPNIELLLHPRDWIEYVLLRDGKYEPLTLRFLESNLSPGQGAILAGVNFGLHLAVAARAVGDSGTAVGVEPQPAAALRTFANLARNKLWKPVKLVLAALDRSDRFLPMSWSDPQQTGTASLFDTGPGLTIRTVTLDEVAELCGSRPRLLLLDVQGFELNALFGLSENHAPELIVIEIDPPFLKRAGVTAGEIYDRLGALGYAFFDVHGKQVAAGSTSLPEANLIGVRANAPVQWIPEQS